jgi:hypothetical protein
MSQEIKKGDFIKIGNHKIGWFDEDTIVIVTERYGKRREVYIDGGDIESLLDGLVSIRSER